MCSHFVPYLGFCSTEEDQIHNGATLKPLLHIGGFRRRSTAVPKPWWTTNERHEAPTEPQVNATKRQWWRWPYGSFALFKTSAVERGSQVCPSWSAAKRCQLCTIVGERTDTATRRRRAPVSILIPHVSANERRKAQLSVTQPPQSL